VNSFYTQIFNRAIALEKSGDYQSALAEYNRIVSDNPGFRPALINLGALYSRMKRHDEAMDYFHRALAISEDYLTWFNIGSMHYRAGDYKQTVIAMTRARRLRADFVLATLVCGLSYSHMRNLRAAEKSFLEVLGVDAANDVALTALVLLYHEHGPQYKALPLIETLLAVRPANQGLLKIRSRILAARGELAPAIEDIKQICEHDAGYTSYNDYIRSVPVSTYTDRYGTLDEKIERLTERADRDGQPEDLLSLSLCHLFRGDTRQAMDCLGKAVSPAHNA